MAVEREFWTWVKQAAELHLAEPSVAVPADFVLVAYEALSQAVWAYKASGQTEAHDNAWQARKHLTRIPGGVLRLKGEG